MELPKAGTVFINLEMDWSGFIEQLREIADAIEEVSNGRP